MHGYGPVFTECMLCTLTNYYVIIIVTLQNLIRLFSHNSQIPLGSYYYASIISQGLTTGQEKKDVTTSSNKPEQGHREDMSDFVTGKPSATNGSTPLATNGSTNSKLVNILDRVTLMFCKSDAELEKKKGKFNELKGRKEEVESYLSEKEKEIERLESETHDASIKLTLSGDVKWRRKSWLNSSRR